MLKYTDSCAKLGSNYANVHIWTSHDKLLNKHLLSHITYSYHQQWRGREKAMEMWKITAGLSMLTAVADVKGEVCFSPLDSFRYVFIKCWDVSDC